MAAMLLVERLEPARRCYKAAAAAAALMLALGVASVVKARLLVAHARQPINNWRWALVWAAAAAIVVGWVATRLPEWAELAFGIPAILARLWLGHLARGFGPEDRVLFRRNLRRTR